MTLKEFVTDCMSDYLPAHIKTLVNGELRFILGVDRLEDLSSLHVADRKIDAFGIYPQEDGKLRWLIVVK